MAILILDAATQAQISERANYAKNNIIIANADVVAQQAAAKLANPAGFAAQMRQFSLIVPNNFLVTYTLEQHDLIQASHLSVSLINAATERAPAPPVIAILCEAYGIAQQDTILQQLAQPKQLRNLLDYHAGDILRVWLEPTIDNPAVSAVNLLCFFQVNPTITKPAVRATKDVVIDSSTAARRN